MKKQLTLLILDFYENNFSRDLENHITRNIKHEKC